MKRALVVVVSLAAACGGGKRPAATTPGDANVADSAGRAAVPADAPPGTPAPEELTIAGAGGVTLAATYWGPAEPATAHGCAIFVHQLSSTRAEWQPVIDRLRGRGHLLAFDMRGHGASTRGEGGATLEWERFLTGDWELVAEDVARAAEVLAGKGADRCVLVGSSIGSSAVLLAAAAHPERTRALVLLSPGLAYRGVKTPDAARASQVPVLIVHSQEAGAADAAGALAGIWRDATPPVPVEIVTDPGDAHGMKIVAPAPAILDRVVDFIAGKLAR